MTRIGAYSGSQDFYFMKDDGKKYEVGYIFLVGHPKFGSAVDNDEIEVLAYPCGTFSHGSSTYKQYSVTPNIQ
jgi:hypothetical protein